MTERIGAGGALGNSLGIKKAPATEPGSPAIAPDARQAAELGAVTGVAGELLEFAPEAADLAVEASAKLKSDLKGYRGQGDAADDLASLLPEPVTPAE